MEKTYVFSDEGEELSKYVNAVWKGEKSQATGHVFREYIEKSHRFYYGQAWGGTLGTGNTGESLEFSTIHMNIARSDIKAVVAMTTQNKLAFDPITTSTDVSAQNNVIVANSLLEQIFYVDKAEAKFRQVLEQGLVYGTSYAYIGFTTATELAGVMTNEDGTQKGVYKGAIDIMPLHMMDVKVEDNKEQWETHDYVMFRRLENRYELQAKHPEVAEEINNLPMPDNIYYPNYTNPEQHPDVWVFYTFHKPTKAIPQGRMMISTENSIVLFDDVNPYGCLPVVCYRPSIRFGSSYGHALLWDLIPVQEAMNTIDSSALTISENFAIPNIMASNTFKANETDISGGMKLIQGASDPNAPNGGFPHAMEMPKLDQSYMLLRQSYDGIIEKLSGVNAAVRGQTSSQQSGTAIALAQSAAQTYNSTVTSGYIDLIEQSCDLIVLVSRLFMTRKEITQIAGMSLDYQTDTFTTASLDAITRIRINMGNALARTISGRVEIGEKLLGQGLITASEYMAILLTGDLPTKVEDKAGQDLFVKAENEMLAQGEHPIISALDNHVAHINKHKVLLDNPLVRKNSQLVALIFDHVMEHIDLMQQLQMNNPILLDIAMGNPIGTSAQMVPPPQPQQQQSSPQIPSADTAQEAGGVEAIAQRGEMAENKLASVGGEPSEQAQ
jgi:hypothetical protein